MRELKRGEIYYIDLGTNRGSEVNKKRPCIIIQNDTGNKYSPTTIVLPITKGGKSSIPTHVELKPWMILYKNATIQGSILAEQVRTVDKCRIGNRVGKLSSKALSVVNEKIMFSVGIK